MRTPESPKRKLTEKRDKLGTELKASVYLYDGSRFIVSAISGLTEHGTPEVLDIRASDEVLGCAVLAALDRFDTTIIDASKQTLADWPAYQASGAKSGRAFERDSMYVRVRTRRSAIVFNAGPRISNHSDLTASVTCSLGATDQAIGAALRKALAAATALREQRLV